MAIGKLDLDIRLCRFLTPLLVGSAGLATVCTAPLASASPTRISSRIVGGEKSRSCHFPSAVLIKEEEELRCTGTLVHPRIVTTAGHCVGGFMTFGFGERGQFSRVTGICKVSPDLTDMAYCKLNKPITNVPVVPILMGCELQALQKNVDITLVGFGKSADESADGGTKREVITPVASPIGEGGVAAEEILLGHAEKGSCNGDSGGPAYIDLRTVDGFKDKPGAGWRVFGVTSRKGPGGENCASTTVYGVIAKMVPWIEEDSGIDITPCFDADGTWNPGEDCKDFPDPHAGGEWPSCNAGTASRASKTCGEGEQDVTQSQMSSSNDGSSTSGSSEDSGRKKEKKEKGCALQKQNSPGFTGLFTMLLIACARRRKARQNCP